MRVVLDTNVIVSAVRSSRGASFAVLRSVGVGRVTPLLTPALFLEYESVLKRENQCLVHGLSHADIDDLLGAIAAAGQYVEIAYNWRPQLHDADDELVLEAAINGQAEALVTHNVRDFERAVRTFGITLCGPRKLLEMIDG